MQDMTLYHSWNESYDKKEEANQKGIETVREAEGDHSQAAAAAAREDDGGKGNGKNGKPKPKPKPSAGPKAKTDEQLARAAVVKANSNLLEISQWRYKLESAGMAQAVAAAFVEQMEAEATKLRDAKSALETALSKGEALSDATAALSDANKAYHTASLQVRKNCDHSYADYLISSLGRGATSCAELQRAAQASVQEAQAHGGHLSELTTKMARLGCYGKYPGNIERDLCSLLEIPIQSLWLEIPVRCEQNRKDIELKKLLVICPHLLYEYLHASGKLVRNEDSISQYWRGRAALVELRGDWKFQREAFALRCHWTAKDCCHLCTARNPSDPVRRNRWTQLDRTFPRRSRANALASCFRWPHPIAALPGFETVQLRFCTMHICNLGILQTLNGSLTSLLCEKGFFGGGKLEDQLRELSSRFRSWARVHQFQHSQGYITVGMLHITDGFPALTCKAWNGQVLLVFLDSCANILFQQHPEEETELASLAARAMVCWFDRLARYGRYLTEIQSKDISKFGFTFLRLYQKLGYFSVTHNCGRWKLLPKHHPFRHVNEDMLSMRMNYRYVHTFKDEDNVGVCKRLAERVTKGDLMEYRVLCRFLLRLASWQPS
eukprot:s3618_g2.t1